MRAASKARDFVNAASELAVALRPLWDLLPARPVGTEELSRATVISWLAEQATRGGEKGAVMRRRRAAELEIAVVVLGAEDQPWRDANGQVVSVNYVAKRIDAELEFRLWRQGHLPRQLGAGVRAAHGAKSLALYRGYVLAPPTAARRLCGCARRGRAVGGVEANARLIAERAETERKVSQATLAQGDRTFVALIALRRSLHDLELAPGHVEFPVAFTTIDDA